MRVILEALHPDPPDVKFVVESGSAFADGLGASIVEHGYKLLSWAEATSTRFDVVLAAHATPALDEFRGPVFCLPHGAGYNRIVPESTGSADFATGTVDSQLKADSGTVIPAALGCSHPEQIERVGESCPDAVDRAVVIGDPVYDQICASKRRRPEYRDRFGVGPEQKLVVVISTWGKHGTVGCEANLPMRLLAQLPADEYRILLIMHPNIWAGRSVAQIRSELRNELDAGLVVIPPRTPWAAGLIAADIVLGDHSSLSMYAAAIGCRFLLAADGRPELVPGSPLAMLCAEATRLDARGDLRAQIEDHLKAPRRLSAKEIADTIFALQGESWAETRAVARKLAGLEDFSVPPRMTAVSDPEPEPGRRVTSWQVSVTMDSDTGTVHIERYPLIAREQFPDLDPLSQVSDDTEVDQRTRENSEYLVRTQPCEKPEGEEWLVEVLKPTVGDDAGHLVHSEARNIGVAAYRHADGCVVQWCDGLRVETDAVDAFAAAVVLHEMYMSGDTLESPGRVEYSSRPGLLEEFSYSGATKCS
ncbi:hypothetical protein [Amycolatopsis solani]|uniref:hypothetical protein n=1 Tax=Amycolatopsis solani TaxID=3028615 RepID=UPI0025B1222F|nr:hypothetical protein [Amycolatopsis sp. MEP2-6]